MLQPLMPSADGPAAEIPGTRGLLSILVAAAVIAGLYFARDVLIPVVSAILLAFVLAPFVEALRRLRIPKTAAVLIAVSLSLSGIVATGAVVGSQLGGLANELPTYTATIASKARAVGGLASGGLGRVVGRLGVQLRQVANATASPAGSDAGAATSNQDVPLPVEIREPPSSPIELAKQYLAPVLSPLGTLALVFVVSVFILLQQTDLRDRLIRLFGSSDLHRTTVAMDDAASRLSRYFLTQLCVNLGFGVVIGIGVQLIGVPHALLWGVVAGLLRFVPFVGGVVSALLPAALAAAVDPGWAKALWTLGFIWSAEALTGQVVEPFLYGHSTGLSPVSVIVAAIFWAWLWGPIGLVLSTPVSLCLLVLGRHVPALGFIEVILGDRPPLTPAESFYQRLLTGNPDECLEQAELLLKEVSLSAYYDQVALKGLHLAANDRKRGVLDTFQTANIRQALLQVIAELEDFDDVDTKPPEASPGAGPTAPEFQLRRAPPPMTFEAPTRDTGHAKPVTLCISGKGDLDQLGATMLAQLLEKHGLDSRAVSIAEVSRERIADLDCTGVVSICVSSFPDGIGASRLRYLIARLRDRCPQLPIIVGRWEASEPEILEIGFEGDESISCFNNLRDLVNACVEAARTARGRAARPRTQRPRPLPVPGASKGPGPALVRPV